MKAYIKRVAGSTIDTIVYISSKTKAGRYLENQIISSAMERTTEVSHKGLILKFSSPNLLCDWRANTFSTKEPETLLWIESIPERSVLWDIGANVGLYAVYAAKKRNCRVWAFEPSVFNLELLARNVVLNDLADSVCVVPLALSDRLGANRLRFTTIEWGGALSTFGKNYGWDGKPISQVFELKTIGLTMDDAIRRLNIPSPDYIKMDVDGIEHVILKGGIGVLERIKGILIEVNDDFREQAEQCRSILTEVGLVLKEKRHSDEIDGSTSGFQNTYNQIWIRP